ncbi:hypothetical protein F4805DRAFT_51921 [Annulohypoxylon moriforme]|nr:hypothetical protein F4805DRAFT_51921 [Annulohypoxylon moriforme]
MASHGSSPDEDLSEVDYLLSEMREHGVHVVPMVRDLILRFSNEATTAQDSHDRLQQKYAHLQAQHSQLEKEFNSYCIDKDIEKDGWRKKACDNVVRQMLKLIYAAVEASQVAREKMKAMLEEHLRMGNENAQMRDEMEELRRENQALKEARANLDSFGLPKLPRGRRKKVLP